MHENFGVILWSKFKVNDDLSISQMREKVDRKFKALFSLDKIDMLVWNRANKKLANDYALVANMKIEFKEDKIKTPAQENEDTDNITEGQVAEENTAEANFKNKKVKTCSSSSSGSD